VWKHIAATTEGTGLAISRHPRLASETWVSAARSQPHGLQRTLEQSSRCCRPRMLLPPIATEWAKMKIAGLLISDQTLGHSDILQPTSQKRDVGHPYSSPSMETWATRRVGTCQHRDAAHIAPHPFCPRRATSGTTVVPVSNSASLLLTGATQDTRPQLQ